MKTKVFLLMVLSAFMSQAQLKPVDYADGDQKLSGFISKPANALKNKAGVLILPAWMGIDDHAKESAEELSKLGYYTFVADIYGVGNKPNNYGEAGQKAGYYKKTFKNIKNAFNWLLNNW